MWLAHRHSPCTASCEPKRPSSSADDSDPLSGTASAAALRCRAAAAAAVGGHSCSRCRCCCSRVCTAWPMASCEGRLGRAPSPPTTTNRSASMLAAAASFGVALPPVLRCWPKRASMRLRTFFGLAGLAAPGTALQTLLLLAAVATGWLGASVPSAVVPSHDACDDELPMIRERFGAATGSHARWTLCGVSNPTLGGMGGTEARTDKNPTRG